MKTYVFDTSWLVDFPDAMYEVGANFAVIPTATVRELDGLKRSDDEHKAKAARKVGRTLDGLGSHGDLAKGVILSTMGVLRVCKDYDEVEGLASDADNKIVGTALFLKGQGEDVVLKTTDGNMRTIARIYGIASDGIMDAQFTAKSVMRDKSRDMVAPVGRIHSPNDNSHLLCRLTVIVIAALLILGGNTARKRLISERAAEMSDMSKTRHVEDIEKQLYHEEEPFVMGVDAVVVMTALFLVFRKGRMKKRQAVYFNLLEGVINWVKRLSLAQKTTGGFLIMLAFFVTASMSDHRLYPPNVTYPGMFAEGMGRLVVTPIVFWVARWMPRSMWVFKYYLYFVAVGVAAYSVALILGFPILMR